MKVAAAAAAAAVSNLNAITHWQQTGERTPSGIWEKMGKLLLLLFVGCSVSHLTVDREQQSGRLSSV